MASDSKTQILPFALVFVAVAGFAFFIALLFGSDGKAITKKLVDGGNAVGLVEIVGPIMESLPIVDALQQLADNDRVGAIVLRIDSPGGAVGPSQEIYHTVLEIRQSKPVIVSMGSVAASGGFYIASAGSKVLANAGTLTGSIGVIMAFPDLTGLMDWAKVKMEVVKTGQFKDTGSGYRPLTTPERSYLQDLIDEVLEQFIADVAVGRGSVATKTQIREVADGRIFTGATAMELGFVDRLGGYPVAVSVAGELAGIDGKPEVIKPRIGPPWYERVLEEGLDAPVKQISNRLVPLWAIWIP